MRDFSLYFLQIRHRLGRGGRGERLARLDQRTGGTHYSYGEGELAELSTKAAIDSAEEVEGLDRGYEVEAR